MAKVYGLDCGRARAADIIRGDLGQLPDSDLQSLMEQLIEMFGLRVVGITIRYPDTHEQHRWESAAMDAHGHYVRSAAVRPIVLHDRLGGGDTWNGGFYYGLLTESDAAQAIAKGVLIGDAATRLKQTLMYDLPVVTKAEIQALLRADATGSGRRTSR
jgi:2-dehydro-3-deoxygluconokinase